MMTHATHPHAHYTAVLIDGNRIDILPTPALLDATNRQTVIEAWESDPATDRYPPIWRLRDDAYDAGRNPTYRKVRWIVRID